MITKNTFTQYKMEIEKNFFNLNIPLIRVGDTLKLGISIIESNRERIQFIEGVVISIKHSGINKTMVLRRVVQGIGVERIYLLHSPQLKSVAILRTSKVRKSKLNYLRSRFGKATRLQQKFN